MTAETRTQYAFAVVRGGAPRFFDFTQPIGYRYAHPIESALLFDSVSAALVALQEAVQSTGVVVSHKIKLAEITVTPQKSELREVPLDEATLFAVKRDVENHYMSTEWPYWTTLTATRRDIRLFNNHREIFAFYHALGSDRSASYIGDGTHIVGIAATDSEVRTYRFL